MIKTTRDFMEWLGLKVGDRVEITDKHIVGNKIFTIKQLETFYLANADYCFEISFLLNTNFKILPTPKRVGDLKCKDFKCKNCPLQLICYNNIIDVKMQDNLFKTLKSWETNGTYFDQEIYDLLKARLDKEVEE